MMTAGMSSASKQNSYSTVPCLTCCLSQPAEAFQVEGKPKLGLAPLPLPKHSQVLFHFHALIKFDHLSAGSHFPLRPAFFFKLQPSHKPQPELQRTDNTWYSQVPNNTPVIFSSALPYSNFTSTPVPDNSTFDSRISTSARQLRNWQSTSTFHRKSNTLRSEAAQNLNLKASRRHRPTDNNIRPALRSRGSTSRNDIARDHVGIFQ